MASLLPTDNRSQPWRARCKNRGIEVFLGYYSTEAEARDAEHRYRSTHPIYRKERAHAFRR